MSGSNKCIGGLRPLAVVLLLCVSLLNAGFSLADLPVGGQLPALVIQDKGELVIEGDKVGFQPWSTEQLRGKPACVQYMAARQSARDINQPFSDALEAANIPKGTINVAAVVNVDDALWGTGGLVAGQLQQNKLQHPAAMLVHDARGLGREAWGLEEKNAAVIILDPAGKVLFARQGKLQPDEIQLALDLLRGS